MGKTFPDDTQVLPLDSSNEQQLVEEDNYFPPEVIDELGPSILELPDYETAKQKLADLYSQTEWDDKEVAAQKAAELGSAINNKFDVRTDVELDPVSTLKLSDKLLDATLSDEDHLNNIEAWRLAQKERVYNSSDTDLIINGKSVEETIDEYADQFRRGVIAGNRGRLTDMMARGAEAALSPILGTFDAVTGQTSQEQFRKKIAEYENPNYDEDFTSMLAGGVGAVGGFAAAGLNPVTGWGYLGATLVDQLKGVYDQTYKDTNSEEAATTAMQNSSPAILIGAFADKIVGGSLSSVMKGEKGFKGVLHNTITGAAGNTVQALGTGMAIASATSDDKYVPTWARLGKEAAVGGIIGGAVGVAGRLSEDGIITKAKEGVTALKEQTIDRAFKAGNEQVKEAFGVKGEDPVTGEATVFQDYIRPKELDDLAENAIDTVNEQPGKYKRQQLREDVIQVPKDGNEAVLDQIRDASGIKYLLTEPPKFWTPMPMGIEFVRQLGSEISLKTFLDSAGVYYDDTKRIHIRRNLFRDLPQAYRTVLHEIGHAADYNSLTARLKERGIDITDPVERVLFARQEPLVDKILGFSEVIRDGIDQQLLLSEGIKLSAEWRTGYTPKGQYRNRTTEIQADIFSKMFSEPAIVQRDYPLIYNAFIKGLDAHPRVKSFFYDELIYVNDPAHPERLSEWLSLQREKGRVKEAEIYKAGVERRFAEKEVEKKYQLKQAIPDVTARFLNRFSAGRKILDEVSPEQREEAFSAYNALIAGQTGFQKVTALIDKPLENLRKKFLSLEIKGTERDPYAAWADYEREIHTLNDTTETMERFRADPELYKAAWREILNIPDEDGKLIDVVSPEDTTQGAMNALVKSLQYIAPHTKTAHQETLLKKIDEDPANNRVYMAGIDLLGEDAFNARRYLGNPDTDAITAERNLSLMKEQLGGDVPNSKWTKLKEVSKEFHDIVGGTAVSALKEAGLITPDLARRMDLNKYSYVTVNVLKYFEKDARLPATIKKAIGTISQAGSELAATIMKEKALYLRAQYQIAQNSALELARIGGYNVKEVKTYPKKSIFETRDTLQLENPKQSYLIGAEDGKFTLYEIDSPNFAKMFEPGKLDKIPVIGSALQALEGFNKVFAERELKIFFSPVYALRSQFYDISNEAVQARSWEAPGTWFHTSKKLRELRKRGTEIADLLREGVVAPEAKDLIDENGLIWNINESYGADADNTMAAENAFMEALGVPIPEEGNIGFATKTNRAINKALMKAGFGYFKNKVERDEMRTKITTYLIGREIRGMGKSEAALLAREAAGTPDPLGGGTEAKNLNKLFLFGRAHINGMRNLVNQFKADPKGFGIQYAYRKGIPRMMLSSAIMAPLIGTLFGEEEGKLTKLFLDKIDEFSKMSSNIIPFGFVDDEGNYRGWNVKSNEVGVNWKAAALKLPLSREIVTIDNAFYPVLKSIEELLDTGTLSGKHFAQNSAKAFGSIVGGNIAPGIQAGLHVGQLAAGFNPTDLYRKKGILTQDVAEAGSVIQKTYDYLAWSLYQTAPGLFSFNRNKQSSTDYADPFDMLSQLPVVGPTMKGFVLETNYGDYEKSKELEQRKKELDADIRLNLGDASRELYNEYRKSHGIVSKLGKNWAQNMSQREAGRIKALYNWQARAYRHGFNGIKDAFMKGDVEAIEQQRDALEKSSAAYLKMLNEK